MPQRTERQISLDRARLACADWARVLDGQVDIFDALEDEGSLEEASKSSSCVQRKDQHEERHAD